MSRAARGPLSALLAASALGLGLRLYAAARVGFGDSEALYAAYALHPAPAYLDHPGLVGLFARAIGDGQVPSPVRAHRVTAILATLAPWAIAVAARGLRAPWAVALTAGLVTAVLPEVAVGLFGMTPDLLLWPAWIAALGLAGAGLLAPPSSVRASALLVLAGLAAGIGLAAKASAAGLWLALFLTYGSKAARPHARTIWPWAGLALGGLVVLPIAAFEAETGWPMLHHRLVATQEDAGVSLRNLGALVGGQLVYLSPIVAGLAVLLAVDLWKARGEGVVAILLSRALAAPLALFVPLCLWSKVAEPHWVAPALLVLPLWFAVRGVRGAQDPATEDADARWGGVRVPRGLARAAVALAAALSLGTYAWVLVPRLAALVPDGAYDARVDISNELYGWPEVAVVMRDVAAQHRGEAPERGDMVIVGPHWVVCAQLAATLGAELPIGCAGPEPADFASWNPRDAWDEADLLIFVTDNRFPVNLAALFPRRARAGTRTIEVRRGGHVGRTFTIELLRRREVG